MRINASAKKRPKKEKAMASFQSLLGKIEKGRKVLEIRRKKIIFSQGDPADSLFFVEKGQIKISVVSPVGKEATLSVLGPGDFFGEGCLVGQSLRMSTATALEPATLLRIDRTVMLRALHQRHDLSEAFMAHLLARNIDLEEDLCDQLFNHSEKRLARVLLKLSRFAEQTPRPDLAVPKLSHETLAEMVGTTRSRVTYFMNKFRDLGLIEYDGQLIVRAALLTDVVLHD